MKLTLEIHLVMRIKEDKIAIGQRIKEMKLTLEIHLVMRINDKSNYREIER